VSVLGDLDRLVVGRPRLFLLSSPLIGLLGLGTNIPMSEASTRGLHRSGEVVWEGQHFIGLIEGQKAALLAFDYLLDGGIGQVHNGGASRSYSACPLPCRLFLVLYLLRLCLAGHSLL
jgi:hypothetical protein